MDAKQADLTQAITEYVSRSLPAGALQMQFDFTARQWGKGRVVWNGWGDFSPYPPPSGSSYVKQDPLWPIEAAEDYALAVSARMMLWAAAREAGAAVKVSTEKPGEAAVAVTSKAADSVACVLRNDWGTTLQSRQLNATGGTVKLPDLPAGTYLVDALALRKDAKLEWASAVLTVSSPIHVTAITLDAETYRPFDSVSAAVTVAADQGGPAACDLLAQLTDAHGRLIDAATRPIALDGGKASATFLLSLGPTVTGRHTVRATVLVGGRARHSADTWFTAVDREMDCENFNAFMLILGGRMTNRYYLEYLRSKGLTAPRDHCQAADQRADCHAPQPRGGRQPGRRVLARDDGQAR